MTQSMKVVIGLLAAVIILGVGMYYAVNKKPATKTNQNNSSVTTNSYTSNANTNKAATTNSTAAMTTCQSADLAATLTNPSGTAGTYYYTLEIKNTGTTTCVYTGSTAVSLVDKNGAALESVTIITPATLSLAAGQSLYAAVGFPNASNYANTSACQAGVTTLAVRVPTQATSVTVKNMETLYPGWTNYACPGFSVGAFSTTKP